MADNLPLRNALITTLLATVLFLLILQGMKQRVRVKETEFRAELSAQ